jgi:hypothetical protein
MMQELQEMIVIHLITEVFMEKVVEVEEQHLQVFHNQQVD